jgi:hypothetical protein
MNIAIEPIFLPQSPFLLLKRKLFVTMSYPNVCYANLSLENSVLNSRPVAVSFAPAAVPDAELPCEVHLVSV